MDHINITSHTLLSHYLTKYYTNINHFNDQVSPQSVWSILLCDLKLSNAYTNTVDITKYSMAHGILLRLEVCISTGILWDETKISHEWVRLSNQIWRLQDKDQGKQTKSIFSWTYSAVQCIYNVSSFILNTCLVRVTVDS